MKWQTASPKRPTKERGGGEEGEGEGEEENNRR
jgi:hypothetical protein